MEVGVGVRVGVRVSFLQLVLEELFWAEGNVEARIEIRVDRLQGSGYITIKVTIRI